MTMSFWVHVGVKWLCGQRGDVVHAVQSWPRQRRSRRKTLGAVCGARVRYASRPMSGGGSISMHWPPYVDGAASVGLTRCAKCFELTGKPKPCDDMGSVTWAQGKVKR